jgi:hypothetical protein
VSRDAVYVTAGTLLLPTTPASVGFAVSRRLGVFLHEI